MGSGCFFVLLWWEFPPWFVHVVPLQGSHVDGLTMAREEEDVSSRNTYNKSPKERFAQVEAQLGHRTCRLRVDF